MQALLKENKITLALAFPIITGQLSQMLIGLIDTLMIGRVGTAELAAAALTNVIFNFPFVVGIGLFAAVSVLVAQAHGAGDNEAGEEAYRNGYLMSLICGVALAGALLATIPFLGYLGQTKEVVEAAPSYLFWMALSLIPTLPILTIKNFAEAKNRPWTILWIMLGGVVVNIVMNYILIFGHFGAPALSLAGAGIATLIARLSTWVALWIYQKHAPALAECRPRKWLKPLNREKCAQIIKIGLPITGQLSMEFGSFAASALVIGTFGSAALAAHQITINCAAFSFMIPLGLAMAVTIRVGHSIGAKEPQRCFQVLLGGHITSFIAMGLTAAAFLFAGEWIATQFTQDGEVIALTVALLVYAAAFQVFDGAQVISMGALRGIKDVNIPTAVIFASFWTIGIPFGAWLAFFRSQGAVGMWMGLATGLAIASIVLTIRLVKKLKQMVAEAATEA